MKVKINTVLHDYNGKIIKTRSNATGQAEALRLRTLALQCISEEVKGLTIQALEVGHALGLKIAEADNKQETEIELSNNEAALLMRLIETIHPSPLITGRVAELLEAAEAPANDPADGLNVIPFPSKETAEESNQENE